MSNARNLARLSVDSSGDVAAASLDNVPASDDASALTTGTLPIARIADGAVTATKLASTLDLTGKTVTLPSGTGGKVLKIGNKYITDYWTTTSTSFSDITGASISFTPTSASSKIWVTYSAINFAVQGWAGINIRLSDGTNTYGNMRQVIRYDIQSNRSGYIYERHGFSQDWIFDSWGTSAKTLKIQGREANGQGQEAGINGGDYHDGYLIVMEYLL